MFHHTLLGLRVQMLASIQADCVLPEFAEPKQVQRASLESVRDVLRYYVHSHLCLALLVGVQHALLDAQVVVADSEGVLFLCMLR